MSKAVMMSIHPKWCMMIEKGKKTVEVRKSAPKLETPFKVYIYETKGKRKRYSSIAWEREGKGAVTGEFVCDEIEILRRNTIFNAPALYSQSRLTREEYFDYIGNKTAYIWHISDLVIYDDPKELSEFYRLGNPLICDGRNCEICNHFKYMQVNSDEWDYDCDCQHQLENRITLKRPPQSWCYVSKI